MGFSGWKIAAPIIVLLILSQSTMIVGAANILVIFQHYGYSHFRVYSPVLQGLIARGHNVTVIAYFKNPVPHSNYHELLLSGEPPIHGADFDEFTVGRSPQILLNEYFGLHAEGQRSCKRFYESSYVEVVLARHAQNPYDLVITEYFNTDCHLGVPYLMDVPVIAFSSCALMPWYFDRILLPDTPSYIQSEFIGFPTELNVFQRLLNFAQAKGLKFLYRYHTNRLDAQIIKHYLNVDVNVNEIAKRLTSVIFVNQHYTFAGSRPLTPQLIEIGGIHITPERLNVSLPLEIANFLNNVHANEELLVISFGSMLRGATFDKRKFLVILKVLQRKNLKVIWKWEADDAPLKNEKILFVKWLPQLPLLCHPKVKYFWGHGGLLGTTEAVYCGKPIIAMPMYGDQYVNAHAAQNRKFGIILDYNQIDEQTVEGALNEIQRPRYTINVQALSNIFRDRESSPLDRAIWHIEHVLKYKKLATELLQTKAVHLNFIVYHSLDSIGIILFTTIVLIMLCRRIFKCRQQNDVNQHVNITEDRKKR